MILIKKALLNSFNLFTAFIMWLPFKCIRWIYIKCFMSKVGNKVCIMRNVEIRKPRNIYIGNNVIINKNVLLDGRGGKIVIGNNVDIAQESNIWTLEHDPHDDYHSDKGGDVFIDDYVWIASRCTILPQIKIGKGAVIATGSIVTKNIETMNIVGGIPAKQIGVRKSKLKYIINH